MHAIVTTRRLLAAVLAVWGIMMGAGHAYAERLSVASPVANVRTGPGTDNPVIWKIGKYHPIEVVEKRGNWYRFKDFEGDQGWIHRSLLADTRTVITRREICNVRKGPGTDYGVAFTVGSGIPFKVLRQQHHWLQVVHADGDKGWIHQSLVW